MFLVEFLLGDIYNFELFIFYGLVIMCCLSVVKNVIV